MRRGGGHALAFFVLVAMSLAACAQEDYPASLWYAQHPSASGSTTSDPPDPSAIPPGPMTCTQARAESYPARLVAMSATAPATATVIFVSDLFNQFSQTCKPCHTTESQGGFQILTASDFPTSMTPSVLAHVTSAVCPQTGGAILPMPPCTSSTSGATGGTYSLRAADDPIVVFATEVQEWFAAGSPVSSFTLSSTGGDAGSAGSDAGTANPYALTRQQGNAMTNLGTCIPSPALVGIETTKSAALDAMFASLQPMPSGTVPQQIGLPEHLSETDLTTLDSAVLAQEGVISYVPGYPLWSDNADKQRYVRVPRGQSIHFNKATQEFEIPPNTRFYKTFTKQIIDTDGSYRCRKIETRLIVSRPDQNNPDGTAAAQTALFGTYQWNADESDAVLVQTLLNDAEPFSDTVLLYDTNEPLAADILSGQPTDPESALLIAGAARHYAIPSSQRCMQCHMGSPSQSFNLGFTPLQINRRPEGEGGVIEPTGPDELTQLQRLIDYGVITGVDSPSDLLLLEQSQGSRTPRNYAELTAQGYVLGNCAHCHNPRGYPTVENPVLAGVLAFLPSPGAIGGLFQFPLERYSPRIFRGLQGETPIPYITPSLVDLPKLDTDGAPLADWFTNSIVSNGGNVPIWVDYAPWRSLIYRNTDSLFTEIDDYTIFPHMPMNTPGFDPRAKQILGDWMVSIPAVRKNPQLIEYAYQIDANPADNMGSPNVAPDSSPQPYVEVLPGDPQYEEAQLAATLRLQIWHSASNPALPLASGYTAYVRYSDLGQTGDIIDPAVTADPVCHEIPTGDPAQNHTPLPEHPDWVSADLTQAPGPWSPRGTRWADVLANGGTPSNATACAESGPSVQAAYDDQVTAIGLLQTASLDQVRAFATTAQPFGLWQEQAGCNFASVPTVQSFTGAQTPNWINVSNPPADAPVYMQTPGASVFKMICINCHGPKADSNGRFAQNLATMTGGNALVADFRDGLFGPVSAPESNLDSVFSVPSLTAALAADQDGGSAGASGTVPQQWLTEPDGTLLADDDRAARYMGWMGLGGTAVQIPAALLQIVAITPVLGQSRPTIPPLLSANMLSVAKGLCQSLLGPSLVGSQPLPTFVPGAGHGYLDPATVGGSLASRLNTELIPTNGDLELWLKLCSVANPHPVHLLQFNLSAGNALVVEPAIQGGVLNLSGGATVGTLVSASVYPSGVPVGNEQGGTNASIDDANAWPWCIDISAATSGQASWAQNSGFPVCPDAVTQAEHACQTATGPCFGTTEGNGWAVRGAINAGMSVFLYVQSIEGPGPPPDYTQCSSLN
jgi:mono/diheme cytochrome c family protein